MLMFGSTTTYIIGYIKNALLAYRFGIGVELDAYNMAMIMPLLFGSLLLGASGGKTTAVFIPVYNKYLVEKRTDEAWEMASVTFNLMLIVLASVTILVMIFCPAIISVIAPGFEGEVRVLTIKLARIAAGTIVFLALAGFARGVLISQGYFRLPALSPLVFRIIIIGFILTLCKSYGVIALAVGTVVAGLAELFILLPLLFKKGFKYRFTLNYRHPGVKRLGKLLIPVIMGLGVSELAVVVDRVMASGLPSGSVTALAYANMLRSLPLTLFIIAIGDAIYPTMTKDIAKNDVDGLKTTSLLGFRATAIIAIPATVGLYILRVPLIRVMFEHGAATSEGTQMIAIALSYYLIGMFAFSFNGILGRMFYASQDSKTPLILGSITQVANIILNLILIQFMGIAGLALASSLAVYIFTVASFAILRERFDGINGRVLIKSVLKISLAAIFMGIVCHFVLHKIGIFLDLESITQQIIQILVTLIAGIVSYILVLFLLKAEEINVAWRLTRRKLTKTWRK